MEDKGASTQAGKGIQTLDATTADQPAHTLHEILRPRSTPRSSTPEAANEQLAGTRAPPDRDIQFFDDDCHEEYEWVRIPKNRDYDIFKVARYDPSKRNAAQLPIIATRWEDKAEVTLWAKMDTGADANVINRSTVNSLLGDSIKSALRAVTLDDTQFALLGHHHFKATHYVHLSFRAGIHKKQFNSVRFYVVPDDWENPDSDGVPNVVLGFPFLKEHSMVMIDVDYHLEAEPGLEVLAPKAEDEVPGQLCLLPYMLPAAPGVKRPTRPKPF